MKRANSRDASDQMVKEWLPQFERLSRYIPRIKAVDTQIAKDPNNVALLLDRARLLTLGERPLLALDDGERAMALQPGSMRARVQTGESLLDTDNPDAAATLQISRQLLRSTGNHVTDRALDDLSACDAILSQNPADVGALVRRAKVLRDLRQYTLALADAQAALAIDNNSADAHFETAHALDELGRTTQAVDQIRLASQLKQDDPVTWYYRGVLESQRANFVAAIDAQTHSLAIRESLVALQERERCQRRIGKVAEADADLRRIAQLTPAQ
ncbi:MAG: hypothetical protein ACJ8KU_08725 [Chthoniobacterales bacterium]